MFNRREFIKLAAIAGGGITQPGAYGDSELSPAKPTPLCAPSADKNALQETLAAIAGEFITIPEEEARLLNLMVKLTRAERVLELGTAHGYTTIWLALALEATNGSITTIEILPDRVALAKKHLDQAGLSNRVRFIQGDAHIIVPSLDDRFDLVYLDADKSGNLDYFNQLFPDKLAEGSLLIAHNAVLLANSMKDFLAVIQQHPRLDTLIIRAVEEDGLALSYWGPPDA